jgi:oligoendopeptidase F
MLANLPQTYEEITNWEWSYFEPFFQELQNRPLDQSNIEEWLKDWTALAVVIMGRHQSLSLQIQRYTNDAEAERLYNELNASLLPHIQTAENALNEKLLASGLRPVGMEVTLKRIQVAAEIFRPANLPLEVEEQKLWAEYGKITGSQTVQWDGQELTMPQVKVFLQDPDRQIREKAWRAMMDRHLQDRTALNQVWTKVLKLRTEMAANAGFSSYRELRWKMLNRFDYTPADCEMFHAAIEEVVVPAVHRVQERRRQRLGLDTLRPWDLDVDTTGKPPLKPYQTVSELESMSRQIFEKVDPRFGKYFTTMQERDLLDLPSRKFKRPGAFSTLVTRQGRKEAFVFMNGVGVQDDVRTILHESGHAFHSFEMTHLPYYQQYWIGSEIAEVASMGMELLASPYLTKDQGGFYTEAEAARANIQHLEKIILFWPYMAIVDAFQHWVYTHQVEALDPANCDRQWDMLWQRFQPEEDWSGLDEARVTGWHRKHHIFQYPFYYVEYGMAQLGAVQIWARALQNQREAVDGYLKALHLGGTASLPDLYAAAGARLAFDVPILRQAVDLLEQTIQQLEEKAGE